jgi:heme exporter protein D
MTYYIEKMLPLGPIRFGVSTRKSLEAIDDDIALNTGPNGEFVLRRHDGFFFGDTTRVAEPVLPHARSISQTAFLSSLKPDGTLRGYGFLALLLFGALLILLGVGVVARKGPQGWLEVVLGLICIAIPIVMTAQRRKQIRDQEERERAAREALETRNRELLIWYTKALTYLHTDRGDAAFEALRGERKTLTVPYEIWGPSARRTILEIGFDELAKRGVAEASVIAELLGKAGDAAGLTPDDMAGVKHDLYTTVFWHLLADDRLGDPQEKQVTALRVGLGYTDSDLQPEALAAAQFRDLRGVTSDTLPRAQCAIPLGFQEYCIHKAPLDAGTLVITNRRLIIDEKKRSEVLLPKVFDVVVDVDETLVTVKTDQKKPLRLRLGYPIFTAAMIDLAAGLDERPKGFA